MWDWFLKFKNKVFNIVSRICQYLLWFALTFIAGFIFHIFWLYIMNYKDFSIPEIILKGNLLLFLMAIIASVFIDEVIFGTYIKNAKDVIVVKITIVVFFIMFLLSSCAITLVQGNILLKQVEQSTEEQLKLLQQSGELEFILAINLILLIVTIFYVVLTKLLSNKMQNTR